MSELSSFRSLLPHVLLVAMLTAVVLVHCGCAGPPQLPASLWPFEEPERTSYRTSAVRIEALRELADEAPKASPKHKQEVITQLVQQVKSEPDPVIRREIVRTLSHYHDPLVDSVVITALKDDDAAVRVMACQLVAERGGDDALAALAEVVNADSNMDVRLAAVRSLGHFKGPKAVDALAVALDDSDPALQRRAVLSLEQSTGHDLGPDVTAWRKYVRTGQAVPAESPSITERLRKYALF